MPGAFGASDDWLFGLGTAMPEASDPDNAVVWLLFILQACVQAWCDISKMKGWCCSLGLVSPFWQM